MKNNQDVKVTADAATKKYLAKLFGCTEKRALSNVISVAEKARNKEDFRK